MAAICLAVIGKNNSPLYIRTFLSDDVGGDNNINDESQQKNDYDDDFYLFGIESVVSTTSIKSTLTSMPISAHNDNENDNDTSSSSFYNSCSVRQRFVVHAALDRLEQLTQAPDNGKKTNKNNFVGLLLPIEETRVYGYVTNTQIKFILMVEDDGPVDFNTQHNTIDVEIQRLFSNIHDSYIQDVMNPFRDIGGGGGGGGSTSSVCSCSGQFDYRIHKHITHFNQSDGMI
mmetsp:Transcript_32723/g.37131  ORF Transcript_32723/g.37131 Transcript_32723/m.37131 type:complete len:230 (+) Transcript_32723:143-832(+)